MGKFQGFLTIFALILFMGCATINLAPDNLRTKTYSHPTNLKKGEVYDKVLEWIARSFNNSNAVLRYQNKEQGKIIAKGNVACDVLKIGNGFAQDQRLDFILEVELKDNTSNITVSDIVGRSLDGAYDTGLRPSNKEESDKAFLECVDPFVKSLTDYLK